MTENFEKLATAVVKQAAADYRDALCMYHNTGKEEYNHDIQSLRKFFTGDTIIHYTEFDGVTVMQGVEKQVVAFNYDLKAIKESVAMAQRLSNEEET